MFASLRIPDFRRYSIGVSLSNIGTWMQRVAQAWLILTMTQDAAMLGYAVALQFAPMLLLGPWAGVLADRTDRRRLLIITQLALAAQALALGVVVLAGLATPALLLAAALLLGIVTAIDSPARATIVSDLVDSDHVVNAVSLNSASFNAARLIGPAVAGLVIAAWGPGWVFVVNAMTFSTMLFALSRLSGKKSLGTNRARGGVRSGLSHVRARPELMFVIALAGLVSMFALNFQMTVAVMATEEFHAGPIVYGVLASTMAVGSLAGSLFAARRGTTSLKIVGGAAVALSLATLTAGLMPNAWLFGVALVLCGVTALTMMTGANSYLQTHSGDEHRSRVMALYLTIFFGTTPVGAPIVGWFADQWGPRAGLVLPGVLALITAVLLIWWFRSHTAATRHDAANGLRAGRPIDVAPVTTTRPRVVVEGSVDRG